ncbi:transcriptional regulator GcvA [Rhodophyticola porphyridii]|uniref:transcriptional regulator GcvA n=1 Tax=Rhodophyticola porphyridii TaxID=1852017 RepID=UPI0035D0CBDE
MNKVVRLPPLAAIRVFEAAARHENFTEAAAELGMTQASVSYQIKMLEERIGAPLFLRQARKVTLTAIGRQLSTPTIEAFDRLRATYGADQDALNRTLAISALPTFATNWLAPRIGRFQMAHPDLAVRVESDPKLIDFAQDEIDLAIRYGTGDWPGVVAHALFPSEFTPITSPELVEAEGPIESPADLLNLQLIDPADPFWKIWLAEAGVATDGLSDRVGSHLGAQTLEVRAVLSGQGVAMLTPRFFRYELETGRLVQPFDRVSTDGGHYWLIYPTARRNMPKIRAFRQWILAEAEADNALAAHG